MSYLRTVNLEDGRPTASQAIKRLTFELHHTKRLGASAVKLIHGYGSSGSGGRIRIEARAYLEREMRKGIVKAIIPGESFSIFDERTRKALDVCGELRKDSDLDRHNNGITIVLV